MIIKLEEDLSQQEIEVLIRYAQLNKHVKRIISLLKSADNKVKCSLNNNEVWINASAIYYIESVDKKTFVYCEKEVYRTELRLYQIVQELSETNFVQVSKSCVLNLNVLESIKPLLNSRLEATLSNGEHINITRKYIPNIKKALEER
jgi:DNA-binding LytR/AlgR family response regulator